jgi:hypothetical protein
MYAPFVYEFFIFSMLFINFISFDLLQHRINLEKSLFLRKRNAKNFNLLILLIFKKYKGIFYQAICLTGRANCPKIINS